MKASHLTDVQLLRWELISTLTGGLSIAIGLRNETEPDNILTVLSTADIQIKIFLLCQIRRTFLTKIPIINLNFR